MTDALPYAVLDIDGVLADASHRLHYLQTKPPDWLAFFAAAPDDPPLAEGVSLAHELARDHEVIFLTGRPERYRQATKAWLHQHELPAGRLLMRRNQDSRPARITKLEVLRKLQNDRPVATVVDDDDRVVTAVRAAGFTVVHAEWMQQDRNQQQALFEAQETQGRT